MSIKKLQPGIGIFDSGVGGLSVLGAIHRLRPELDISYVADSAHAPYGDREPSHVIDRSLRVAEHLNQTGAALIVVACNTATALAIDALRHRYPQIQWVGVEPGIKPAIQDSINRSVAVMATPATLASARFSALVERYAKGASVVPVPCQGLAAAIERGSAADAEIDALLDRYCLPLRDTNVDTVVLGCTHYPFIADRIAQRLGPQVRLLDTASAVARHTLSLLGMSADGAPLTQAKGQVRLLSTGDAQVLDRLAFSGLGLTSTASRLAL